MRMVKSLLLGSAAGLVAVAGAQAADLPVKAKPVEYVRVCSLYGAGFWYVPGTDTCLKIGSFVRVQTAWNTSSSDTPIGAGSDAGMGRQTRTDTANFGFRTRAALSVDLRTQTEYGTLRSYMDVGAQWSAATAGSTADNNATTAYPDLDGGVTSLGHNLIGTSTGGAGFAASDRVNVNPDLGPLQNNGGPTQTMALLPGSPAINAGDNTNAPADDQRGPGARPPDRAGRRDAGAIS